MLKPVVTVVITAMLVSLLAVEAHADTGCALGPSALLLRDAARIVHSLHADKPGQARVFAADGSEYTAGGARWMNTELDLASRACARGDDATAARHLNAVRSRLKTH